MSEGEFDIVVVGAGPAGLAAACEAREHGLSVLVLDEQSMIGGQIYRNIEYASDDRVKILGKDYVAGQSLAKEFRRSGADYRPNATVWNVGLDGAINFSGSKSSKVQGRFVILASGAMERPFPIKGWTLPGVMGAGAAQILLKAAGAQPKGPLILAGSGPLLYLLAWQYLRAGIKPAAVLDTTELGAYFKAAPYLSSALIGWKDLSKGIKLLASVRTSGVPVFSNIKHLEIDGEKSAESVTFVSGRKRQTISASLVVLHQGVISNSQLSLSTGAEHVWNSDQLCWQPVTDRWGKVPDSSLYVVGDSRAIVGALGSKAQGRLAALKIAQELRVIDDFKDRSQRFEKELKKHTRIRPLLDKLYRPSDIFRIPADNNVLICRCEEVTAGQIRDYVKLGCLGPNQTKTFGRCGMGPCQGRLCGLSVTEIIASERNVSQNSVGHYRVRPPIKPVSLGELARSSDDIN